MYKIACDSIERTGRTTDMLKMVPYALPLVIPNRRTYVNFTNMQTEKFHNALELEIEDVDRRYRRRRRRILFLLDVSPQTSSTSASPLRLLLPFLNGSPQYQSRPRRSTLNFKKRNFCRRLFGIRSNLFHRGGIYIRNNWNGEYFFFCFYLCPYCSDNYIFCPAREATIDFRRH